MSAKEEDIVLQSREWGPCLGTSLLHMQERGLLCDVQLYSTCAQPAQPIVAHSCVLAAASTTLSSLVQGTANHQLHLPLDLSTMKHLVVFCYIGRISIKHHELASLHRAASEYGIKQLQNLCMEFLSKEPLTAETSSLSFEPRISTPLATSQLPILSQIEGLDTFESSQELTFDVHFPSESSDPVNEHPKPTDLKPEPPKPTPESYLCQECGKIFDKLVNLQMHEKRHKNENSNTTFSCKLCDKVFKSKQNLQVHGKSHSNDKAFQCAFCAKRFVRRTELTMHERTHTGERPYTCKYCPRTFAQSTNLTEHERTHTGARPYTCDKCDAAFSNSSNLRRHKAFHARRLALGLPPQLRQRSEQMKVLPSGERIFPCTVCEKHFKRLRNLEDHLRTHTGEKPFKCSFCQRGFARQPNLIRHEKFHKKNQSESLQAQSLQSQSLQSQSQSLQSQSLQSQSLQAQSLQAQSQSLQSQSLQSQSSPLAKRAKSKIAKTKQGRNTNDLVNPIENIMDFTRRNTEEILGYDTSQNVFLATDTAVLATRLPDLVSSVSNLGEILPTTSSSVPISTVSCASVPPDTVPSSTDLFLATAVSSPNVSSGYTVLDSETSVSTGSTFYSTGYQIPRTISVSESGMHVMSSVPHSMPMFNPSMTAAQSQSVPQYLNSFSLIPISAPYTLSQSNLSVSQACFSGHTLSSVPQSISVVSGSHPMATVPHSVSTVPHSIATVPHASEPGSSVLQTPHSVSAVPQTSLPPAVSTFPQIPKSGAVSQSSQMLASNVDLNLPQGSGSFPDTLGNYFGPGGFMAQLDGVSFPQTLNPLYLQPTTEAGNNM